MLARMPLMLIPSAVEFDLPRRDRPPAVQYVGPCLWPSGERAAIPRPEGRSRLSVLVDEGALYPPEARLLRSAVKGLGNRPFEVLVLAGRGRDIAVLKLGELPKNVRLKAWAPGEPAASWFDVVVTNGNTNSVVLGLSRGIPLVVVPSTFDQAEIARRVQESGAGLWLAEARSTPERLRTAVDRVLTDPCYRASAERMAGILAGYGGPSRAAELLTDLASRQRRMAQETV
jgi:MGT family glycosyltransferase